MISRESTGNNFNYFFFEFQLIYISVLYSYNSYLLVILNASICIQNGLGLCDPRIFDSRRCQTRCGNCRGIESFVLDVAQAARTIVGSSTTNDSGLMAKLCAGGKKPSLGDIVAEWSFHRTETDIPDSNARLPDDLLQFAVLVLCAHEFIVPRSLNAGRYRRSATVFEPAIPALVKRLYPEVNALYADVPFRLRAIGAI